MIGFIGVCLVHRRSRLRVLDPPCFGFLEADLGAAEDVRFLDTAGAGAAAAAGAATAAADAAGADTRFLDAGGGFSGAEAEAAEATEAEVEAEAAGAAAELCNNNSCLKSS